MKLVRDGYINTIEHEKLDLSEKTYEQKLNLILDKIREEAIEYAETNFKDPEELSDLFQAVIDLGELHDLSFDCVNSIRKRKELTHGGFKNFVVLN